MHSIASRAVLAATVLVSCIAAATPARADLPYGCHLHLAAGLRMQADIAGRPLIPVTVEGHEHLFVVDTGGVDTMLTYATAQALRLRAGPTRAGRFVFVNGDTAPSTARATSFRIGQLPLGRFNFLITPPSMALPGAAGALGPDIMRHYDVELDFAAGRFNLFTQEHCDGGVVHWTRRPSAVTTFALDDSGHMTAVAMLDGRLVDVIIDTGAVATSMTLEDATAEFGLRLDSPGVQVVDDGGGDRTDAVYAHRFRSLNLEGIEIRDPTVVIRPDRTGLRTAGLRPELILGISELRKLHLYIAYRERKIYITGANDR